MENGVLAGFPMVAIKASLVDGSTEVKTASEMAYKIAASIAFKEAAKLAESQLLEPVFKLEITTPEEFLGSVISDLNSRRGRVTTMSARHNLQVINAEAPLASLFGYATDIRSLSQGRASFSMEFLEYAPVQIGRAHV